MLRQLYGESPGWIDGRRALRCSVPSGELSDTTNALLQALATTPSVIRFNMKALEVVLMPESTQSNDCDMACSPCLPCNDAESLEPPKKTTFIKMRCLAELLGEREMLSLFYLLSLSCSRPVHRRDFKEHVRLMSADSDFRFAEEYMVRCSSDFALSLFHRRNSVKSARIRRGTRLNCQGTERRIVSPISCPTTTLASSSCLSMTTKAPTTSTPTTYRYIFYSLV